MSKNIDYGLLLNKQDIKLHRNYFKEMTSLIGIIVLYRAPKISKTWSPYGDIDSNYDYPIEVGCIFDEHPNHKTMKILGWDSELQETPSIISVPYDLQNLQVGALFIVPSAFDNTVGRLFRVTKLSSIMIYPASITCQIVPEYENTFDKELLNHNNDSFNLLNEEGNGNLF